MSGDYYSQSQSCAPFGAQVLLPVEIEITRHEDHDGPTVLRVTYSWRVSLFWRELVSCSDYRARTRTYKSAVAAARRAATELAKASARRASMARLGAQAVL